MKKRIISALLLASMLMSLVACGGDSDKDKTDNDKQTGEETPAGIEAADYDLPFNI